MASRVRRGGVDVHLSRGIYGFSGSEGTVYGLACATWRRGRAFIPWDRQSLRLHDFSRSGSQLEAGGDAQTCHCC
jgi:hypothetical protein